MFNSLNTSATGALIGIGHLHAWVWRQFRVWEGELNDIGTVIGPWLWETNDPDTGLPLRDPLWYFNGRFGGRQISTTSCKTYNVSICNIQCINLNLQFFSKTHTINFIFQILDAYVTFICYAITTGKLVNYHLLLLEINVIVNLSNNDALNCQKPEWNSHKNKVQRKTETMFT